MSDIIRPAVEVGTVTVIVHTKLPKGSWVSTELVPIEIEGAGDPRPLRRRVEYAAGDCLEAGLRAIAGLDEEADCLQHGKFCPEPK